MDRVQSHTYMTNGILTYGENFSHFLIYDFAPDPISISLYMRKILFSFLSVWESTFTTGAA
jgi:hypothetical protein